MHVWQMLALGILHNCNGTACFKNANNGLNTNIYSYLETSCS